MFFYLSKNDFKNGKDFTGSMAKILLDHQPISSKSLIFQKAPPIRQNCSLEFIPIVEVEWSLAPLILSTKCAKSNKLVVLRKRKRTINNNFVAKWFTTLLGWHTIPSDDSSTTFCRVKSILLFMRSTVEYKKLFKRSQHAGAYSFGFFVLLLCQAILQIE